VLEQRPMAAASVLDIDQLQPKIDHLPMLPSMVVQLLRLNPERDDVYDKIYQMATTDPALCSFIISYANSAASSPSSQISNLHQALVRIGAATVVRLVTTMSVSRIFTPTKELHKRLWQRAIETAVIAEYLAKNHSYPGLNKELAYLCGLLSDLGSFVLCKNAQQHLDIRLGKGFGDPRDEQPEDYRLLGISRAEIGLMAAQKMHFPQIICSVVEHHQDYRLYSSGKAPALFSELLIRVQIARCISGFTYADRQWMRIPFAVRNASIEQMCKLPEGKLPFELVDVTKDLGKLKAQAEELMSLLNFC